jgi:hypothetical protein
MRKIKDIAKSILAFSKQHPLIVITLVSLICLFIVSKLYGYVVSCDTQSYQYAADLLSHGHIDVLRTPCYPLVIAICQKLTSPDSYGLLVFVQTIVFYWSVYTLYWTMLRLGIARNIAGGVTFIVAVNPMFLGSQISIMTESFAVSFSIFLVSYFVKWIYGGGWRDFCGIAGCTLFLVFLRPSFMYMLVAMLIIVVVLLLRAEYKKSIQLTSIVCVCIGLLFLYCKNIEAQTGIFTPSTVCIINDYGNAAKIGKLRPENITDTVIKRRAIEAEQKYGRGAGPCVDDLPWKQVYDEFSNMKRKDKLVLLKFFVVNARESAENKNTWYYGYHVDFGLTYLFLMSVCGYFVYNVMRRRRNSVIAMFLWLMCVGNIFVDLLGSNAAWSRLFLPSVPLVLLLIALVCNRFKITCVKV